MPIITILPAHAQDTRQVGVDSVVVTFSDTPTHFSVQKAPLKYNKAFAMSFQEDDALSDIFNQVYPAFEGINNNPGMFYSDGCGNAISFKMSSAIYIFAANFTDLLNPDDPWHDNGKLTWTNLKTLYHHGWGIENHGLFDNPNVSSSAIIDYAFKRTQSYAAKKISDSILFKTFVIPNNVVTYVDYLTKNQYHSAVNQGQDNSWIGYGADGFDVESDTINWLKRVTLNRSFIQTGFKSTADALYADSKLGIHKWFLSGMHAVPGSFLQELFQIYQTYGQAGLDDILIAPDDEILDYLAVKQATQINTVQKNNKLKISFSGNIPTDRLQYALSLNITADKSISNIQVYGTNTFSFAGVGKDTALVNLSWQGRKFYTVSEMADSMTTLAVNNPSQYTGLVAMDYVQMLPAGQQKITLQKKLCGLDQSNWTLSYDDFFCNPINLGNDTSLCEGNGISLKGPDGMQSYEWKKSDNNTILGTSQNIELFPEQSETVLLKVTSKHGNIASDSIHVNLLSCPVVSLGNDTSMQIGDSLILRAPTGTGYQYNWNTGDTTSSLTCKSTQPDTLSYSVQVVNANHCQSEDTIRVITYKLLDVPVVVAVYDTIKINQGAGVTVQAETYLGTTFVWRHDSISDTTTVGEYTFYPDKSVKVYVKACNTDGCSEKDSTYVEVMTQPVPTGFLKSDTSFCAGSCIVLNGPDNMQSYEWQNKDNNTYVSSDQYIQVCPKKSETLSLKIVTLAGDTTVDSIHLNLLPTPNVNLGNDTTITIGDSLTLLAPTGTGYQYLWNNGDTTQSVVCSSSVPDTLIYSVEVNNSFGCTDEDTIRVFTYDFNRIPIVSTTYDTIEINPGDSAKIEATTDVGNMFAWKYKTTVDVTEKGSFTFSPAKSVMVYVKACNDFGCSEYDSTYVWVFTGLTDFLKSDTSFCAGSCIVLKGPDNMQSYNWRTTDDNTFLSSDQYIEVCPANSETVSLQIITLQGDTATDSIHLNVLPSPTVNLGNDTSITVNDSLILKAPVGNGFSYLWNTGETAQSIVCHSSTPDTLFYSVNVSNSYGCQDEDTIRVITYKPLGKPLVFATFDTLTIALGDSATVKAKTDDGTIFAWRHNQSVDITSNGNFTFYPEKSLMVYVKACNVAGCSKEDSTFVKVVPVPPDFMRNDTTICAGSCLTIYGPNNMKSYKWETSYTDTIISEQDSLIVCPEQSTTYFLSIVDKANRLLKDSVRISTQAAPDAQIQYTSKRACINSTITLSATDGYHYQWLPSGDTTQSIQYLVSDTSKVYLKVTNDLGCTNSDSLTIYALPMPKMSISGLLPSYCSNDQSVVLTGKPNGGEFSGPGINGNVFFPNLAGPGLHTLYYTVSNEGQCTASDSASTFIYGPIPKINLHPADTTLLDGGMVTYDAGSGFSDYYWTTGDTTQIVHIFYSDFPNGTDTITVIGLAGACTSVGNAVIHFGEPTGLSEFYDNNILVFPNPNKGIFSINWPASNEKIIFSLTDITGHLIMQKEIPRGESQLKLALPGLKQGLYLIHFQSERGFWIKKVMIR